MKTYKIYKKRDGQSFEFDMDLDSTNLEDAKKEFAKLMTEDIWKKSNDIAWLDEEDGVDETGWYNLDGSVISKLDEDTDRFDNSDMDLFCSKKDIDEGFDYWNEDVYTWKLQEMTQFELVSKEDDDDIEEFLAIDMNDAKIIMFDRDLDQYSIRLKN